MEVSESGRNRGHSYNTRESRYVIGDDVRRLEAEIEDWVATHRVLSCDRDVTLRSLLNYHCSELAEALGTIRAGRNAGNLDVETAGYRREDTLRESVFWAIKLVLRHSSPGSRTPPRRSTLNDFVEQSGAYGLWFDCLKSAEKGRHSVHYRPSDKTIVVYEGGDKTGCDATMIAHRTIVSPHSARTNFTHDTDQLTTHWTALAYRKALSVIARIAQETHLATAKLRLQMGGCRVFAGAPVQLPAAKVGCLGPVVRDMTLEPDDVQGTGIWRWHDWFDTPLIRIDGELWGTTATLGTLASHAGEDHMLRLAAARDPDQYSRVTQLREPRMKFVCERVLEAHGWELESARSNNTGDVDVLARRRGKRIALQLKSVLRPQAPMEVWRRNDELLKGIRQLRAARHWLPADAFLFVITDGYRGDYEVWDHVLRGGVPVGTTEDLVDIASRPGKARVLLEERIGISPRRDGAPLPVRRYSLGSWTLELLDQPPPT